MEEENKEQELIDIFKESIKTVSDMNKALVKQRRNLIDAVKTYQTYIWALTHMQNGEVSIPIGVMESAIKEYDNLRFTTDEEHTTIIQSLMTIGGVQ